MFTPEDYISIFKKFGVTRVVRLNKKEYDREKFIKNGIKHTELYFIDGSTPSDVRKLTFSAHLSFFSRKLSRNS